MIDTNYIAIILIFISLILQFSVFYNVKNRKKEMNLFIFIFPAIVVFTLFRWVFNNIASGLVTFSIVYLAISVIVLDYIMIRIEKNKKNGGYYEKR